MILIGTIVVICCQALFAEAKTGMSRMAFCPSMGYLKNSSHRRLSRHAFSAAVPQIRQTYQPLLTQKDNADEPHSEVVMASIEEIKSLEKVFQLSAAIDGLMEGSSDTEIENEPETEEIVLPSPNFLYEEAVDVVNICMEYLLHNDDPQPNAGLEVCFNFSSERCRAAQGGTLESFLRFASNPTFGFIVDAKAYTIHNIGPIIPKTLTRGDMQTILVEVHPANENLESRKYLWTMQRARRPPQAGCWLVYECLFVNNAYQQTL